MAKIRVEQIKDLMLTPAPIGDENVTRSIQIGTSNSIVPLTDVEVSGTGDYISGASVSGNIVKLTTAALPGITVTAAPQNLPENAVPFVRDITASGHTITKTMGAIGNGLAINDDGVLNLNLAVTPAAGSTGQVISGLSYANGVLAPTYSTVAAANVTIADAGSKFTAENVEGALAELAGSIAAIDPVVTTVAAGTGISVTPSATLDAEGQPTNDVTYTVAADFTVDTIKYGEDAGVKAGKTYIRIMDGETVISETDAAAFVKDGFLASVTKDAEKNELVFTWNTDAEAGEANQITRIAIKDLCDVYTVGEGLVASEDGYTFSHQAGATGLTANTVFGSGSVTDDGNKVTVNVPSVTVDKFGHVSALTETEVSFEIPESVASAVQKVTGDDYVTASRTGNDVTLTTKTKAVADATADTDGLATAQSVKTYVDGKIDALDAEVTSTDGTNVQVKVTEVNGKITAVNVTTDNSVNAGYVTSAITTAIEGLDSEKENETGDIKVKVSQVDGKLSAVTVSDTLAAVAHSGKAADVSIADADGVITATTVEGALAEIAAEIDAMDLTATDVVALNEGKTALQAGKISETDGKVAVAAAETLVEFNQAISSGNKVATMADVTAAQNNATVVGQEAIVVAAATGEGATGKVVSLKIKSDDKILDQTAADGLFSTLSLTYDTAAQDDGKKYIRLKGKNNIDISTIDASDFIKDGMLESATLVTNPEEQVAGKYIKLTFNLTDAQGGNDPIFINVTDLVDVYTADETYITLGTDNKFSHKTPTGLTAGEYGVNAANVTVDAAEETATFTVPSFTVDAAGHVTAASEKTVTVTLPAAPATVEKSITTYIPKKKAFTSAQVSNNTVELPEAAYDYDVYLNGQLLSAGDANLGTDKKTITLSSYAGMITEGDEIIVRYFVEQVDTVTVFAPATQA